MGLLKIPLTKITVGAAGADSLIELPVGKWRYLRIILLAGNTAAGDANAPTVAGSMGEIVMELAGKNIGRVTAARLDSIQTKYGAKFASRAVAGGANGAGRRHLTINFARPWRKRGDGEMFAVQTGHLNAEKDTFQIRVRMATGITPALTGYAIVDDFSGGKAHALAVWETLELAKTGTPLEINEVNAERGFLGELNIFDPSGGQTIDNVLIEQNSVKIFDMDKTANGTENENGGDMTFAAGIFPVVFDMDDDLRDVIPCQGLQVRCTTSAAATGTLAIVRERIFTP